MSAAQQKQIQELQARVVALENNLALLARVVDLLHKRGRHLFESLAIEGARIADLECALSVILEPRDFGAPLRHLRARGRVLVALGCAEAKRMESDATDRQAEEAIRRLKAEQERDANAEQANRLCEELDRARAQGLSLEQRAEKAERDLSAANRELERWRHGWQVEGDYVCPDSLRAYEAEKCAETMERERDVATAQAMALQAEVIQLRAALDSADCTHREGGDTRHCRPDAPCWRCRAEKAAADAAAMRSALEKARNLADSIACACTGAVRRTSVALSCAQALRLLTTAALSGDAGKEMLEELTHLRERVSFSTAEKRKEQIRKLQTQNARLLERLKDYDEQVDLDAAGVPANEMPQGRVAMLVAERDALRAKVEALEADRAKDIETMDSMADDAQAFETRMRDRISAIETALRELVDAVETMPRGGSMDADEAWGDRVGNAANHARALLPQQQAETQAKEMKP